MYVQFASLAQQHNLTLCQVDDQVCGDTVNAEVNENSVHVGPCGASTIQMLLEKYVFCPHHATRACTHSAVLPFCVCSFSYCVLASAVRGPQGLIKGGRRRDCSTRFPAMPVLDFLDMSGMLSCCCCSPAMCGGGACCSRAVTGCSRKSGDLLLSDIEYQMQSSIRGFHFISWGGPGGVLGGSTPSTSCTNYNNTKPFLTLPEISRTQ